MSLKNMGQMEKKVDPNISQGRGHPRLYNIIIPTSLKMSSNVFKLNFWYYLILLRKKKVRSLML